MSEPDDYCGVFDADMEMTPALAFDIQSILKDNEVIKSPVEMYLDGFPLKHGSLYPPKPIVFRTGKSYFEPVGHGERLLNGVGFSLTRNALIHNDLKSYSSYLESQIRYSEKLVSIATNGHLTWRDRLRLKTPLLIIIAPLYSLFVKKGLFSKKGWAYALDRLIAEAIMYRTSLRKQIGRNTKKY